MNREALLQQARIKLGTVKVGGYAYQAWNTILWHADRLNDERLDALLREFCKTPNMPPTRRKIYDQARGILRGEK